MLQNLNIAQTDVIKLHRQVKCICRSQQSWHVGTDKVTVELLQLPENSVRPPAIGSAVQVRWVDGSLYGAVFKGINAKSSVEVRQSGFQGSPTSLKVLKSA